MRQNNLARLFAALGAAGVLTACTGQSKQISELAKDTANEPVLLSMIAPKNNSSYDAETAAFNGISLLGKKDPIWAKNTAYPVVLAETQYLAPDYSVDGTESAGMRTMEVLNPDKATTDLTQLAYQERNVSEQAVDAIANAGQVNTLRHLAALTVTVSDSETNNNDLIKAEAIKRLSQLPVAPQVSSASPAPGK